MYMRYHSTTSEGKSVHTCSEQPLISQKDSVFCMSSYIVSMQLIAQMWITVHMFRQCLPKGTRGVSLHTEALTFKLFLAPAVCKNDSSSPRKNRKNAHSL